MFESGTTIAIFGAGICAALAGCGSAVGVMAAGKAAAGVTSEKPDLFGKMLVLQALPGTQGIYGLLVAVLIMFRIGMFGGAVELTLSQGWQVFFAAM
ncbi:MAG TPA: permease, partial [Bacillota bacterium]|nr:permease [Bacillota bacterium]